MGHRFVGHLMSRWQAAQRTTKQSGSPRKPIRQGRPRMPATLWSVGNRWRAGGQSVDRLWTVGGQPVDSGWKVGGQSADSSVNSPLCRTLGAKSELDLPSGLPNGRPLGKFPGAPAGHSVGLVF